MEQFEPSRHIIGGATILEKDGGWPSFHDAEVYSVSLWRGDMRPDDDVWIGPVIEVSLELAALEFPFVVDFKFHDCDSIELSGFNHGNMIYDLAFSFEERGHYADGVTPLTPYVCVAFEGNPGVTGFLSFKCFRVEIVGRRAVVGPPYA
jgi:Immunity protein 50